MNVRTSLSVGDAMDTPLRLILLLKCRLVSKPIGLELAKAVAPAAVDECASDRSGAKQ